MIGIHSLAVVFHCTAAYAECTTETIEGMRWVGLGLKKNIIGVFYR